MYDVKDFIFLAEQIRAVVMRTAGTINGRVVKNLSEAGDAQFEIDNQAEKIVKEVVGKKFIDCLLFSEDYHDLNDHKKSYLIIIDPIDGTRPAAAGLEMSTIAIAIAKFTSQDITINDILQAFIMELKTGAWMYADHNNPNIRYGGYQDKLPNLNKQASLENMFWSFELNGHPAKLMVDAWGHIVDQSANRGGVFLFNSASYSILKIITGQLDAYIDVGNRILKDNTTLLPMFQKVGNGKVLHLFPYDIAAISFIAEKAGVIITDAYGKSLNTTKLLDLSWQNQQSCIAAATQELHDQLINMINWHVI